MVELLDTFKVIRSFTSLGQRIHPTTFLPILALERLFEFSTVMSRILRKLLGSRPGWEARLKVHWYHPTPPEIWTYPP